jgi:hypothetical protein
MQRSEDGSYLLLWSYLCLSLKWNGLVVGSTSIREQVQFIVTPPPPSNNNNKLYKNKARSFISETETENGSACTE